MRVNDRNALGSAAVEGGRTADTKKSDRSDGARAGAVDQGSDRVEFSSSLSRLSRAISVDNARRNSHVQALAAAYQAGTYQPNSLGASRGLIAEATGAGRL
jgi:hypothetical protein